VDTRGLSPSLDRACSSGVLRAYDQRFNTPLSFNDFTGTVGFRNHAETVPVAHFVRFPGCDSSDSNPLRACSARLVFTRRIHGHGGNLNIANSRR